MTKERPILFSGPMVRAILDGRKTQTRRVDAMRGADRVFYTNCGQLAPGRESDVPFVGWVAEVDALGGATGLHLPLTCKYGQPGDRLWVKETFHAPDGAGAFYRADWENEDGEPDWKWKPSIFMPRKFSRITLEITGVRVERLNEISKEDAYAEGIPIDTESIRRNNYNEIKAYREIWESINGPGSWEKNPWVWVVEFKRLTPCQSPC